MAKFKFQKSSCVALGSFNIYVIQPQVLHAMGVLDQAKVGIAGDLTAPGIRFEANKLVWTVRPDRLAAETVDPSVDCASSIRLVLENLLWTPVLAVGLNYTYSCALDEPVDGMLQPPIVQDAVQCSAHVGLARGEATVNIQLSRTRELQELAINVNYDLAEFRLDPRLLNAKAVRACSRLDPVDEWIHEAAKITGVELINEQK